MITYKFKTVKIYWFSLLYTVFCQAFVVIGYSILLGLFKPGDDYLDVFGVDARIS